MPVNDRALFKAFQVFILDVLDALGHEDDTEGDSSLRAAEREAAAAPVVARPRKAEREVVTAMLNKVSRLQNQGKMVDAAALRETIPKGRNFERAH